MADFVEEVEERLRAERYGALARRGWPWFAGILVAVIVVWLAVWGWRTWQAHNIAEASVTYDKALTALAGGDETGAFNTLAPVAKSGPAAYRALSLMLQGDMRLRDDKATDAAGLYDQAAKAAPGAFLADLARLKAALALMDTASYPQIETRLDAIIGDKRPFDGQAREALAMAKLQAGRTTEARGDLNALSLRLTAAPDVRDRAKSTIALIDAGQAKDVAAAAKLAATLPPPSPQTLSAIGGGAPEGAQAPAAQASSGPQ